MATANQLKSLSRKRQSPIDLNDDIARPKCLRPLTLIGHWLNDGDATLINTGDDVLVHLGGERIPSIVKCGPLNDDYEFYNVHFHWGEDDSHGSEHSINGTWFSMEAHAVHWNRKYPTFEECLKYEDGLCILAYLFLVKDLCDCKNYSSFEKITDNLNHVVDPNSKFKIAPNVLCWMREATRSEFYYFYRGSYNKDDYPECALWIIFPKVIPIRADQLAEFRKLKNNRNEEVKSRRREIQHLNNRKIYKVNS